ncbi:hypothetical protein B9Z55_016032 [Caenorhabditis nigoni]|uniref:Uncharacterized protein n=1 Tax=Caenorhabditis nigoni TaxID=1611254 RepID=A0A2G5UCW5_9PELO|nr:hypothetical protein B9Z55_016032 [Caenorhabditis nigoni]
MPTFKLEDMDENQPYGGDNDMYFRQWRLPSMKPVLDEKLDRDFLEGVAKKDEAMRKKKERRQKHSEKYDKKFQELVKAMSEASVKEKREEFLRKPTEEELKRAREELEREFASPSSTARMVPFKASIRPRQNPIFGEKMVSMKDLVLPAPSAPQESTFGAHETVFYPQTHDSFNLDHYNGSRPSFAFSGIQGATSTPVSAKGGNFFGGGIPEELEDSVFESSKYVTAMESPIQKASGGQKTMWETPKTGEGQKTTSLGIQKVPEVPTTSLEAQKPLGFFQKPTEAQKAPEALGNQKTPQNPVGIFQKAVPEAQKPLGLFQKPVVEQKAPEASGTQKTSLFGFSQKPVEAQKPSEFITTTTENQKPSLNPLGFLQKTSESSNSPSEPQKPLGLLQKPSGFITTTTEYQKPSQNPLGFLQKLPEFITTTTELQKTSQDSLGFFQKTPEASKTPSEAQKPIGLFQKPVEAQKPASEAQKPLGLFQNLPEPSKTSSDFQKPLGLFQKPLEAQTTAGSGSILGQKLQAEPMKPMGFSAPSTGNPATSPIFGQKSSPEVPKPVSEPPALPEPPKPSEKDAASSKPPSQPYILFKNYINLLKTLQDEKKTFETSSDPQFRALLKRTITEKVTVFTERQTSPEARSEILEFFKTMLQKKPVDGFAVIGKAPSIRLEKDEEVNYAVHCVVEKYISLAELDEELAPTISDLISRLSAVIRRVEKVFIVLMFNKSTLLRQNPKECLQKFVEHVTAENSDEKAIEWNQEQALSTLFFTVFAKNAFISTKGRKMVLSDELLWKYVETSIAHVLEVPKASFILLQLITICKPRLFADEDRWIDMLATIESEILPELEADPFAGDEAVISQLAQMVAHLLE